MVPEPALAAASGRRVGPGSAMPTVTFRLNGRETTATYEEGMHFLEVLREECGVVSAKDGCSPQGTCGC
jgi:aerobic-type carbon monoxide dehydrogenase small subunit (CoxS/CutS family)